MGKLDSFGIVAFDAKWLAKVLGAKGDQRSNQVTYIVNYLHHHGATRVLVEPRYFDHDYLAEFAAFYGVCAQGYKNSCIRLHFFKAVGDEDHVSIEAVERAATGKKSDVALLQRAYLGFAVVRPIPDARLGRTVLAWFPDTRRRGSKRITNPIRDYESHVAGFTLRVRGLAWQQQDAGVSACATIALWSMLSSSANDPTLGIPTTVEITRAANRGLSLGAPVFPSSGLTVEQLQEAIKELGLTPILIDGCYTGRVSRDTGAPLYGFLRERFSSTIASLIRSGYPVLVIGELGYPRAPVIRRGLHAVCLVGFREKKVRATVPRRTAFADAGTEYVYIHDDNIGPNARFRIHTESDLGNPVERLTEKRVVLLRSPPSGTHAVELPFDPKDEEYLPLVPTQLMIAVHSNIRVGPGQLLQLGLDVATSLRKLLDVSLTKRDRDRLGLSNQSLTLTTRFRRLPDYLADGLREYISDSSELGRTRISLQEVEPPMSLFLGVVRISLGPEPIADILVDTTGSDLLQPVFACVIYEPKLEGYMKLVEEDIRQKLGTFIIVPRSAPSVA